MSKAERMDLEFRQGLNEGGEPVVICRAGGYDLPVEVKIRPMQGERLRELREQMERYRGLYRQCLEDIYRGFGE